MQKQGDKWFEENTPFRGVILIPSILLIVAVSVAAFSALFLASSYSEVMTTRGSFMYCSASPVDASAGAWFSVKSELSGKSFKYEVRYGYDTVAFGSLSRVVIRGPFFNTDVSPYVANPANALPVALTLCGGEHICATIEAHTCVNKLQPDNCHIVVSEIVALDSVTPDVPLNPLSKHQIHDLTADIERQPQNYVFEFESATLGTIMCTPSVGSIAKL